MCLPGLSLVVSAHFRWSRSISFHLSPRSVTAGDATFLFICLPGLSLAVSTLFRWGCNISIHLFPRSVTANVRPFLLAMQLHLSPRPITVYHWWCPPFSAGHVAFLFICLPHLSLLVSAPFSWPCSISIHLSPRSVTAGVRPFLLVMQHFYSFVSQPALLGHVAFLFISQVCHWWCPPLDAGHVAFLYSFVSQVCHCQCPPFSTSHAAFLFISQVCHCWCPPLSVGHAAFLFICLSGLSLVVSALCRWPCSISILLSPRSVTGVSLSIGHESFLFICLPGPSM